MAYYLPWSLLRPQIFAIIALIAIQAVNGDREACSRLCGQYMGKPSVGPVASFKGKERAESRWPPQTSSPRWAPQVSDHRPSRRKPSYSSLSARPNSELAGREFRPSQLISVNGNPVSSLGGGAAYNAAPGAYAPSSYFPSWQSSSSWESSPSSSFPSWQSSSSWGSKPSSSSGSLDDSWGGYTSPGSMSQRFPKHLHVYSKPKKHKGDMSLPSNGPQYPPPSSQPPPSSRHRPQYPPPSPSCTTLLCPLPPRPSESSDEGNPSDRKHFFSDRNRLYG